MSSARKPPTRRASPQPSVNAPSPVPRTPSPDVPLAVQLKCAQRELALRKSAYPGWVRAGRLNVFKAEEETAAMAAIVKTLQGLIDGERT